jgi:rRNA maturation endonuclease Nob1
MTEDPVRCPICGERITTCDSDRCPACGHQLPSDVVSSVEAKQCEDDEERRARDEEFFQEEDEYPW